MEIAKSLTLLLLISTFSYSEKINKTINAFSIKEKIIIDGKLSENLYKVEGRTDFRQRDPIEDAEPSQRTEIWIGYDDEAIYIGARLYDTAPDSIIKKLVRRDSFTKSDWFLIGIDSYFDRRNAFFFGVNPAGSIIDGTFYNDSWDDDSWDGIWDRAVAIDDSGWTVEMKIPYSQLRFSKKEEYIWGFNALRIIGRYNEEDYFVMVPKKESGFVSHFAELTGIRNINPPKRIEILPYILAGSEFSKNYTKGDPFNTGKKFIKNFGTDFKIGLGSNLTLDATINPDFGQVEVDPAEVNLTQFETYYSEKRPFFIEGANIFRFGIGGATNNINFNWANPQFFYSRRIGRKPQRTNLPEFNNSPLSTTILSASKITGKISNKQSIGILGALTEREFAEVDENGKRYKIEVEPFSFYGIGRTQFLYEDGRYGLGCILTSTERDLRDTILMKFLTKRAYTFGNDGWIFLDENKTWVISGWTGVSLVEGSKEKILKIQQAPQRYFQRPDAEHLRIDSSLTSLTGFAGRFALNKEKNNLFFNSAFGFISPSFEINDLGYQYNADIYNGHIATGYRWYKPDRTFRYKSFLVATARSYNFGGDKTMELYFSNFNFTFINYWSLGGNLFYNTRAIDTRTTRGGPSMLMPSSLNISLFGSSDSRSDVVFEFYSEYYKNEFGSHSYTIQPEVEWKPTPAINISCEPNYNLRFSKSQYINQISDIFKTETYGKRYIFGELNQKSVSANIRINWTFTPVLTFQLYMQPLISAGKYSSIKEFARPKSYDFVVYGSDNSIIEKDSDGNYRIDPDGGDPANSFTLENPNFNFKSFKLNVVVRWEFSPGSTIYFVWTQNKTNDDRPGIFNIAKDLKDLISTESDNVFMIKVAYWFNVQ